MPDHPDNETWIIHAGDAVISKKARLEGGVGLSPVESLIYCLWVTDYGMRNAGDLLPACDLYPDFQRDAAHLATELGLEFTCESFSLPMAILQKQYHERFDRICMEIRNADPQTGRK